MSEYRAHSLDLRFGLESPAPGEHFVQNHAEAENIGAMIGRAAADLFGRHVADGSHDDAGIGFSDGLGRIGVALWGFDFGEAEIENLGAAVARHHDVVGLQIAMDNAGGVSGSKSVGDLHSDFNGAAKW